MAYRRMVDLHIHTDNSFDGNHSAMFLCEEAVHKGLRSIAFTDHMDVDLYEEHHLDVRQVQSFFEVAKARSAFKGKMLVIQGIELGQGTYNMPLAEKMIERFDYDYIIGSIHELRGKPDFSELKYDEMTADEIDKLLEQYFIEELTLAQWGHFDTLAHLTYPLRYIVGNYGLSVDISKFSDIIDRIFMTLIAKGKALEINTSGLRQKIGDTMPNEAVIRRFRELGGEFVTIGSDAHFAKDVGAGIRRGMEIAENCGFKYITLFQRREPIPIPIEKE